MPQRPYLPLGTLREALAYPSPATDFHDDALVAACNRVGLTHLASELDRSANWDNELASDELQRLAFARLLLHKPNWVCVNEAAGFARPRRARGNPDIFDNELAGAAVISLGHRDLREGFSSRVLHLIKDPARPAPDALCSIPRDRRAPKPAVSPA